VKPYVNVDLHYYDLSMENRDNTDDKVIQFNNIYINIYIILWYYIGYI
jgi:hypothetical protein